MLVSKGKVVILDYEVGHIGHPAFDVASVANHLFLKSVHLRDRRADFLQLIDDYLNGYLNQLGRELPRDFWPTLGALMLARVLGKSPAEYLNDQDKPVVVATGARLLAGAEGLDALK
jgi:hypothetical protein